MKRLLPILALVSPALGAAIAAEPRVETYEETLARMPAWLAERAPKVEAKAFSVDPARVRFLDLTAVANRSYGDRLPGDGEGGWTDQGENHLRHAPWGVTDCNGVPFDFIRPDQNDDRACVILRSTRQPYLPDAVRGIEANLKARTLYFLHAGAWLQNGQEAFRYVVRYADGTSVAIPMVCGRDFLDWWIDTRKAISPSMRCRVGWMNTERRGFHVARWANPSPEKTIATIDIVSACTGTIPIIEAITAELASPDVIDVAPPWCGLKFKPWGGVMPSRDDEAISIDLDDATQNWAGTGIHPSEPIAVPDDSDKWSLVFEVNGGRTPLGRFDVGGQPFQISLPCMLADGNAKSGGYAVPEIDGGQVDADPASWQVVRLPLRRLLPKDAASISGVGFQFRVLPANRAGVLIRDIRLCRDSTAFAP